LFILKISPDDKIFDPDVFSKLLTSAKKFKPLSVYGQKIRTKTPPPPPLLKKPQRPLDQNTPLKKSPPPCLRLATALALAL
jgi:hypothetical protein